MASRWHRRAVLGVREQAAQDAQGFPTFRTRVEGAWLISVGEVRPVALGTDLSGRDSVQSQPAARSTCPLAEACLSRGRGKDPPHVRPRMPLPLLPARERVDRRNVPRPCPYPLDTRSGSTTTNYGTPRASGWGEGSSRSRRKPSGMSETGSNPSIREVTQPFRILSLDGGGICGAFEAGFLAGLEAQLEHRSAITSTWSSAPLRVASSPRQSPSESRPPGSRSSTGTKGRSSSNGVKSRCRAGGNGGCGGSVGQSPSGSLVASESSSTATI